MLGIEYDPLKRCALATLFYILLWLMGELSTIALSKNL